MPAIGFPAGVLLSGRGRKSLYKNVCIILLYLLGSSFTVLAREDPGEAVARVASGDDLQAALADSSVIHVVLTAHLDLLQPTEGSPSNVSLPMAIVGSKKTIRVRVAAAVWVLVMHMADRAREGRIEVPNICSVSPL